MSFQDRVRTSWKRLPQVIRWLVALRGIGFLAISLPGSSRGAELVDQLGFRGTSFLEGRVWQPLTSMFVSLPGGLLSAGMDIMILWILGSIFARRWRPRHFLVFLALAHLISLGIGWAAFVLFPSLFTGLITGMNGPIMALFTAFYFVFGEERFLIMGLANPVKGKLVFLVLVGLDALFFVAGANPHFGVQVGGLLAGWLLVTGRWRPARFATWFRSRLQKLQWEQKRKKFRVVK